MGVNPELFRKIFDSLPFPKVPITLKDKEIEGYFTSKVSTANTDEFGFSEEYDGTVYLPFNSNVEVGSKIKVLNDVYIVKKMEDYYVGPEKVAIKVYLKKYYV